MPDSHDFIINKSFKSVSNEKFDLVVSTAGPYSVHLIALRLRKRNLAKFWIADYRDLWTQNNSDRGLFPFTILEEYLERKVNLSADVITTVSEPLAEKIRKKYKLTNVETIENGFDPDDLGCIPSEPFWSDGKVRLVYTGAIYKHRQDPSPLFEAISQIKVSEYKSLLSNLEVIFVGFYSNYLRDLIVRYGVCDWVKYLGFVSRQDALRMQRDAHGLIFLEADEAEGILTGKLFEYLYSGTQIRGIGVTDRSSSGHIIKVSGQGINFGRDVQRIRYYIIDLLKSGEKPRVRRNTELLDRFSIKTLAEKMIKLLDKYSMVSKSDNQ